MDATGPGQRRRRRRNRDRQGVSRTADQATLLEGQDEGDDSGEMPAEVTGSGTGFDPASEVQPEAPGGRNRVEDEAPGEQDWGGEESPEAGQESGSTAAPGQQHDQGQGGRPRHDRSRGPQGHGPGQQGPTQHGSGQHGRRPQGNGYANGHGRFRDQPQGRFDRDQRAAGGPAQPPAAVTGLLEIDEKGRARLRDAKRHYAAHPEDPEVGQKFLQRFRLRSGVTLEAQIEPGRRGQSPQVMHINSVMGMPLGAWQQLVNFEELPVIDPRKQIRFETKGGPVSMRVIDLMCPIGFGSRGLIVAPPRSGKTVLLQQMAAGIAANHPDARLIVLLVDERPEEVTEMRRSVKGETVASSNDMDIESHVRVARLVTEKAKRHVEAGEHVIVLMDSLTRLGRTFNAYVGSSGRTMTGGMDIKAMEEPKKMFGAARNIEGGGSLTIIATALIDTGSRMDDYIFQEFKGTGNMEIVLDREMANRRVFPAIDLQASGTRKEHLLLGEDNADRVGRHIRRKLLDMRNNEERMDTFKKMLGHHESNDKLLDSLPR